MLSVGKRDCSAFLKCLSLECDSSFHIHLPHFPYSPCESSWVVIRQRRHLLISIHFSSRQCQTQRNFVVCSRVMLWNFSSEFFILTSILLNILIPMMIDKATLLFGFNFFSSRKEQDEIHFFLFPRLSFSLYSVSFLL